MSEEVRRSEKVGREKVGRGSGNDSRPELNLCPRGHCSPYMGGLLAPATVPPKSCDF